MLNNELTDLKRLLKITCVLFLIVGCGGGRGKIAQSCGPDEPCQAGVCIDAKCVSLCSTSSECGEKKYCQKGVCVDCESDQNCIDSGTGDRCVDGVCQTAPKPDTNDGSDGSGEDQGQSCQTHSDCNPVDFNLCQGGSRCLAGKCVGAEPVICSSTNDTSCTANACNPKTGACEMTNVKEGQSCEDNDLCTVSSTCQSGVCKGEKIDCSDGKDCSTETCDPKLGCQVDLSSCVCQTDDDCDDDNLCNGKETCDKTTGTCKSDDSVKKCDGASCTFSTDATSCSDDGNKCTLDRCENGICTHQAKSCVNPQNKCTTGGTCNTETGQCEYTQFNPEGGDCDGNKCTQNDSCEGGECKPGTEKSCYDSTKVCTTGGTCVASTGECSYDDFSPPDGECDANKCTQNDSCSGGQCQPGMTKSCVDPQKPCTAQSTCNSDSGLCEHKNFDPPEGECDGNKCTLSDTCIDGLCSPGDLKQCEDTNAICTTGATCNTSSGLCEFQPVDPGQTGCDGKKCTVPDSCSNGQCTAGTPKNCVDPTKICTSSGTCSEVDGNCDFGAPFDPPNANNECDNNRCTVGDRCVDGGCQPGSTKVCKVDSDPCKNKGSCNTTTGACVFGTYTLTGGEDCDGNPCTTGDTCEEGTCKPGTTNTCDCETDAQCNARPEFKNDPCNDGKCTNNVCIPQPVTGPVACDDKKSCTGEGVCVGGSCTTGTVSSGYNGCLINNTCLAPGTRKPGDKCLECNPTGPGGKTDWSAVVCPTNSNQCKQNVCNAQNGCVEQNKAGTCDDGLVCTGNGTCLNGNCSNGTLTQLYDGCLIGSTCVPRGNAKDQQSLCSAICDPDQTTSQWSAKNCNDGKDCTTDSCSLGQCSNDVKLNRCLIGTVCYSQNDPNPQAPCQLCDYSRNPKAWVTKDCSGSNDKCLVGTCKVLNGKGVCSGDPVPKEGQQCNDDLACTGGDICKSGVCTHTTVTSGCLIAGQCITAGTAKSASEPCLVCDPAASKTSWSPKNCSGQNGVCRVGACDNNQTSQTFGKCIAVKQVNGETCDDKQICTSGDSCNQNGDCTGTPKNCTQLDDECVFGECNTTSGLCEAKDRPNGTDCEDGDQCTLGDKCNGTGTCVPGSPKDCSGDDGECTVGKCNTTTGACYPDPKPNGTGCDDNSPCTTSDKCNSTGTCIGTGNPCQTGSPCRTSAICTPSGQSYVCDYSPDNGKTCSADAYSCTIDQCQNGSCSYSDSQLCTGCSFCDPRKEKPCSDKDSHICCVPLSANCAEVAKTSCNAVIDRGVPKNEKLDFDKCNEQCASQNNTNGCCPNAKTCRTSRTDTCGCGRCECPGGYQNCADKNGAVCCLKGTNPEICAEFKASGEECSESITPCDKKCQYGCCANGTCRTSPTDDCGCNGGGICDCPAGKHSCQDEEGSWCCVDNDVTCEEVKGSVCANFDPKFKCDDNCSQGPCCPDGSCDTSGSCGCTGGNCVCKSGQKMCLDSKSGNLCCVKDSLDCSKGVDCKDSGEPPYESCGNQTCKFGCCPDQKVCRTSDSDFCGCTLSTQ